MMLLIAVSLFGCAGAGDYRTEALPGGYEIWRNSAHDVLLVMPDETGTAARTVIESEIIQVCMNERFICVQQKDYDPKAGAGEGEISFYVLDSQSGTVSGPFDEEGYLSFLTENSIADLTDWTDPDDLPKAR